MRRSQVAPTLHNRSRWTNGETASDYNHSYIDQSDTTATGATGEIVEQHDGYTDITPAVRALEREQPLPPPEFIDLTISSSEAPEASAVNTCQGCLHPHCSECTPSYSWEPTVKNDRRLYHCRTCFNGRLRGVRLWPAEQTPDFMGKVFNCDSDGLPIYLNEPLEATYSTTEPPTPVTPPDLSDSEGETALEDARTCELAAVMGGTRQLRLEKRRILLARNYNRSCVDRVRTKLVTQVDSDDSDFGDFPESEDYDNDAEEDDDPTSCTRRA